MKIGDGNGEGGSRKRSKCSAILAQYGVLPVTSDCRSVTRCRQITPPRGLPGYCRLPSPIKNNIHTLEYLHNHTMDPSYTPTRNPPLANHEATTRRKAKFFEAIDSRAPDQSIRDICNKKKILYDTGKYWLRRRRIEGSSSIRRIGKNRPGRTPKISTEILQKIVNSVENLRVIHKEFKGISIYEVRARIAEMPWRCR